MEVTGGIWSDIDTSSDKVTDAIRLVDIELYIDAIALASEEVESISAYSEVMLVCLSRALSLIFSIAFASFQT